MNHYRREPSIRLQGRGGSPSGPKIQAQRAVKPKSTIGRLLAPFIFLPAPLRYGWLPAYTFDFPAAYALSRGCSYFILLTSSFAPPCCSLCDNPRFRIR